MPGEQKEVAAAVRALGLGALPAVIEKLDALAKDHAARPAMGKCYPKVAGRLGKPGTFSPSAFVPACSVP